MAWLITITPLDVPELPALSQKYSFIPSLEFGFALAQGEFPHEIISFYHQDYHFHKASNTYALWKQEALWNKYFKSTNLLFSNQLLATTICFGHLGSYF